RANEDAAHDRRVPEVGVGEILEGEIDAVERLSAEVERCGGSVQADAERHRCGDQTAQQRADDATENASRDVAAHPPPPAMTLLAGRASERASSRQAHGAVQIGVSPS